MVVMMKTLAHPSATNGGTVADTADHHDGSIKKEMYS
jgi:hypothetical protein